MKEHSDIDVILTNQYVLTTNKVSVTISHKQFSLTNAIVVHSF